MNADTKPFFKQKCNDTCPGVCYPWCDVTVLRPAVAKVTGAMTHVAFGESGVWGVNSRGDIFYREGSYNNADNTDQCAVWSNIPGSLKQIDVGRDFVIGVSSSDDILYRTGISPSQPTGTNWSPLEGSLKHVTVSSNGSLWGVNSGTRFSSGLAPVPPAQRAAPGKTYPGT
ncbi:lectin L6-like [Pomacea canaliculata]|uniref:lectin L6-like n=1 Tax=Pomacea canaliculata TaxID=400727 RepID=UPI000D735739|nr:lectin L6-like [Pomacea canaliculata]XP_025096472.1 lectin L6-like [Pomacea canaliculata]XP_025096473.1 lectin L6-like [Pomacea canaliculata]